MTEDIPERGDPTSSRGLLAALTGEGGPSRREFLSDTAALGGGALALSLGATGGAAAEGEASTLARASFRNQNTDGRTVFVESALLSDGGYVTIHDASLLAGEVTGSVIGVSDHLDPGLHENVEVPLFDVKGASFGQSRLGSDQWLVAMPHMETNDNGEYDFVATGGTEDGPYVQGGQAVVSLGFVTLGNRSTVVFENQATDGTSVTVRSTTLSDGGFVTIHDAGLFQGDALGSVVGVSGKLDAGRHEDVEVPLFQVPGADFEQSRLQSDQPLVAMPHFDTNGNGQYDFVATEGAEDGPYTEAGQAVVDLGFASVDGSDGGGH